MNHRYQIDIYNTYNGWRGKLPVASITANDDSLDAVERRINRYACVEPKNLEPGTYIADYVTLMGELRTYVFTVEREDVTISTYKVTVP